MQRQLIAAFNKYRFLKPVLTARTLLLGAFLILALLLLCLLLDYKDYTVILLVMNRWSAFQNMSLK